MCFLLPRKVTVVVTRLFLALLCTMAASFVSSPSASAAEQGHPGIADGAGIWMNIWSYPKGDTDQYCRKLQQSGIRNLFIQTSRPNTPAIQQSDVLGRLIDSCHHHKIRTIAWSFAELQSPEGDARKLIDAAHFRTPEGHGFDAIAPNLEKDLSYNKVEKYSQCLRKELGESYPMIVVVYSPLNKAPEVARTPWKLLDRYYNVIAPMSYWNSKYAKLEPYGYTRDTINRIRELVGRPDVEIHVVGDGMKTHSPEIKSFMSACRDTAVASASLYPFHQVTEEQYDCMTSYFEYFPMNSRYRLAAFSKLYKSGVFSDRVTNPARAIERGEFYRLLTTKLTSKRQMTAEEASTFLCAYGVIPHEHKTAIERTAGYLREPMGHKEAYVLVARALEADLKAQKMGLNLDGKHPVKLVREHKKQGEWFVLPALAENIHEVRRDHLNYLDASQIILDVNAR